VNSKTKLVSLVHVSNALGTILPTQEIAEAAQKVSHTHAVPVYIDLAITALFSTSDRDIPWCVLLCTKQLFCICPVPSSSLPSCVGTAALTSTVKHCWV